MNEFSWLGKKEELEFRKQKFRGKNAGKIFQYSNHVDGLIRTRVIILAMVLFVFYPVLRNYVGTGQFHSAFFFERLIFSAMFLIAGLLFNKFRILSIVLAALPALVIAATYLLIPGNFHLYKIAYSIAILLLILSGLYYNSKVKKLEKELNQLLLENQLIDRTEN